MNGRTHIDPSNTLNRVRVMDDGYMVVKKHVQYLDMNGNHVVHDSPDAHIPADSPMKSPFLDTPGFDVSLVE